LPVVIPIVIMQMISTYFLFVLDDATLTAVVPVLTGAALVAFL
jgi:hypothetical protein